MRLIKNKKTGVLMLIMSALVFFGIVVSHFYYKNSNESVDPRIIKARTLYDKYNGYAQNNEFDSIFLLMDSIEFIYSAIDHYKDSYEIGVLYNNRAASFIGMALYPDNIEKMIQDSLIDLAEIAVKKSIAIYHQDLEKYQNKHLEDIEKMISDDFYIGLDSYNTKQQYQFLKKRVKEIEDSQIETRRRLSVSYTNLGIIYRYKLQYKSAATCYKKAIDLWDKNLTAENNLNILLARPLKKRNFIQKMFPPDRDKN